jgi:hypothetical protein
MGGGIVFRFTIGETRKSAANLDYITRESENCGNDKSIFIQSYPSYALAGDTFSERRRSMIEFARQQEQDELVRPRRGSGETRTHYRAIGSFEEKVSTEQVLKLAQEFIENNFPNSCVIAVVHQDTDNSHVHFHIQARNVYGKKIHLNYRLFRNLDRAWGSAYQREHGRGRDLVGQLERKKTKMRDFKRDFARGLNPEPPDRLNKKWSEIEKIRTDRTEQERAINGTNANKIGRESRRLIDSERRIASTGQPSQERERELATENREHENQIRRGPERDRSGHIPSSSSRVGLPEIAQLDIQAGQLANSERIFAKRESEIDRIATENQRTVERFRDAVGEIDRTYREMKIASKVITKELEREPERDLHQNPDRASEHERDTDNERDLETKSQKRTIEVDREDDLYWSR